jgi:uncharacterized protein YndB with AHSA1/START domain
MADIIHEFTVKAPPERVFPSFATPAGMEKWWTKTSSGESRERARHSLVLRTTERRE